MQLLGTSARGSRMAYCRIADFIPASIIAAVAFASVATATLAPATLAPAAQPAAAGPAQVAVIFPPWVDLAEGFVRIANANGRLVRQGLVESILVAQPDGEGFVTAIYDQGAILVIDPTILGGCLTIEPNSQDAYL